MINNVLRTSHMTEFNLAAAFGVGVVTLGLAVSVVGSKIASKVYEFVKIYFNGDNRQIQQDIKNFNEKYEVINEKIGKALVTTGLMVGMILIVNNANRSTR